MPQQISYDDNGVPIKRTPTYDDAGNEITAASPAPVTASQPLPAQAPTVVPPTVQPPVQPQQQPVTGAQQTGPTTFNVDLTSSEQAPEQKSWLNQGLDLGKQAWDFANTPVLDLGVGKQGPEIGPARQLFGQQHPVLGGIADMGLGVMESASTPLNMATGAAFGLGNAASIPGLIRTGRILSAPVAAEGAINLASPDSTWPQRIAGGLELAGGIAGMRAKTPKLNEIPEVGLAEALAPLPKGIDRQLGNKSGKVILHQISQEIVEGLAKRGYRPGGVTKEGKPYMILVPDDPARINTGTKKSPSLAQEIWNLPRGMSTTFDMSAPLRQGLPLIGTRNWWKNWSPMVRAWGSDKAYQVIMKSIEDNPLFQKKVSMNWDVNLKEWKTKEAPSIAEKSGLAMTDMGTWTRREELIQSQLAEQIPGFGRAVKASNRAYTAFLNKLRADTFAQLYGEAAKLSKNGKVTQKMATEIAEFVNDATGRGKLSTQLPNIEFGKGKIPKFGIMERSLESHAEGLSQVMFSPRLAASRVRMLNPLTYTQASPFVRKQYLKAALSTAAAWTTASGLGALTGGDVSINPTSADFGKVKFGDMRIDPGAGFQQFLTAYVKMLTGTTTSTSTGNTRELGEGYQADTRFDIGVEFGANKLHPMLKFAVDMARASEYRPVQVGDRILQMYVPLVMQDMLALAQSGSDDIPPEVAAAVLSFFGMGSQVYGRGGKADTLVIPPEMDYTFEGGLLPGMQMFMNDPEPPKRGKSSQKVTR